MLKCNAELFLWKLTIDVLFLFEHDKFSKNMFWT